MNQRVKATVLVFGILLLGLIMGVFLSPMVNSFLAPTNHKTIVDKMTIMTGTSKLEPAYLSTGTSMWTLSLVENFLHGGTYSYTLWVYSYQGDPEVTVCIWGPGEDGKTYQVELSAFWYGRSYTATIGTITKTFQNNTILEIILT
jgi:hypothetical protein